MENFIFKPRRSYICDFDKYCYFRLEMDSAFHNDYFLDFVASSVFIKIGDNLYLEAMQYESDANRVMDIIKILKLKNLKNGIAEFEVCEPDLNVEMYDVDNFKSVYIREFTDDVYNHNKDENGIKFVNVIPCDKFVIECDKDNLITLLKYKDDEFNNKVNDVKSVYYALDHNDGNGPLIKFDIINGEMVFNSIYSERYNMYVGHTDFNLDEFDIDSTFDFILKKSNGIFHPVFYINNENKIKISHPSNFKKIIHSELFKFNPNYFKELLKDFIDRINLNLSFKELKRIGVFELYLKLDKTDDINDVINLFNLIKGKI